MPRNITATFEDDIIARRYALPTLARSTPFNRAISCELKSLLKVPQKFVKLGKCALSNLFYTKLLLKNFLDKGNYSMIKKMSSWRVASWKNWVPLINSECTPVSVVSYVCERVLKDLFLTHFQTYKITRFLRAPLSHFTPFPMPYTAPFVVSVPAWLEMLDREQI